MGDRTGCMVVSRCGLAREKLTGRADRQTGTVLQGAFRRKFVGKRNYLRPADSDYPCPSYMTHVIALHSYIRKGLVELCHRRRDASCKSQAESNTQYK